jgi:serine/threonine protein kinase
MLEPGHYLQQRRYRIKARLNQGGMGTVYLATDRNLSERLVAREQ